MEHEINDINTFYSILEVLNSCSIETFKIIKDENGNNIVTGVSDNIAHCILDTLSVPVSSYNIGITRSKILAQRMKLFDLNKTKSYLEVADDEAKMITLKQDNRKASYRFSSTSNIKTPITIDSGNIISKIPFDQQKFNFIRSAIGSMKNPEHVSIYGKDSDIWIDVTDEYGDSFQDVIGTNQHDKNWCCTWKTTSLLTLVQKSLYYIDEDEEEKSTELKISETNFGFIDVKNLSFSIIPRTV